MRSGPLFFLLRLLLACSLVLGGVAPVLAQAPAGMPAHGHCHEEGAGQPMALVPDAHHADASHAAHPAPAQPAHGCCADMAACLGHCALVGALPVAVAAWPVQALPVAALPRPADAGHAPPAPRRLIRPPITA